MKKLLLVLALLPAFAVAQESPPDQKFSDAMAVCDNMTIYVQMAMRQRDQGMPLADAKSLVTKLMSDNLNMPADTEAAVVALAMNIYDYVYSKASLTAADEDSVLANTCGKYQGNNFEPKLVAAHLQTTAQSAWEPTQRVPLCVKLAQTAANIAAARDHGMQRPELQSIVLPALANDPFTLKRAPALIDQVYGNTDIKVTYFFAYNFSQCTAEKAGNTFPTFKDAKPSMLKCQLAGSPDDEQTCAKGLFSSQTKTP